MIFESDIKRKLFVAEKFLEEVKQKHVSKKKKKQQRYVLSTLVGKALTSINNSGLAARIWLDLKIIFLSQVRKELMHIK